MNWKLKDYRFWCLSLALLANLALFAFPTRRQAGEVYNLTFVIDITRSMNAEDYRLDDQPVSRLAFVKHSLRELLGKLPCQSKIGLGVFTERRSTLLFEPVEVCSAYTELASSIDHLDWRMAWAADSRIAGGLLDAMQLLQERDSALIFVSDGQEAPPLNPRYRTDFSAIKGKLKGMIIGAGGLRAVAIPKFDRNGKRVGVYGPDDVPHRSSFGESDLNPEKIEGYDARNAPFGKQAAVGSEHLSALREGYLQQLALETGLQYRRLSDAAVLAEAVRMPEFALPAAVETDVRRYYAVLVLLLLLAIFI
ncbi:VWA domain-containing protein [Methylomonas sp. SURF-2]|uniref:VWA domain-containing protein n=1 Tax=Methylomonas subterranea TaxID=2952225 RepID=A0ABT1TG10_9GAMM|nr:vWA domain-containing protein [Methylomonas sp. SURF-2]MCQ8104396.1 VWA domain-containing protein [Methylomonas sp. SURF-2]